MHSFMVCLAVLMGSPGETKGLTVDESGDIKLASGKTIVSMGDKYVGMRECGGFVLIAAKDRVGCFNPGKKNFEWLTPPVTEGEVSFVGSKKDAEQCYLQVCKGGLKGIYRFRRPTYTLEYFPVNEGLRRTLVIQKCEVNYLTDWEFFTSLKGKKEVQFSAEGLPKGKFLFIGSVAGTHDGLYLVGLTEEEQAKIAAKYAKQQPVKTLKQVIAEAERSLAQAKIQMNKDEVKENIRMLKEGKYHLNERGDIVIDQKPFLEQLAWYLQKELEYDGTRKIVKGKHVWETPLPPEHRARNEKWMKAYREGTLVNVSGRIIPKEDVEAEEAANAAQATPQTPPLPEK